MRSSLLLYFHLILIPTSSFALSFNLNFIGQGNQLGTFGTAHGMPTNSVGGGNLDTIMAIAASYWENAFSDNHVIDVDYGWFPRSGSTVATHRLVSEGGSPHRETAATIAFDTTPTWFMDSTPWEASEYGNYTEYSSGWNTGRVYSGASGAAANNLDLVSFALHELGHALGLSSANDAFRAEVGLNTPGSLRSLNIDSPLPYAGNILSIDDTSAHLEGYPHALLDHVINRGTRRLASEIDILASAQISQFTGLNLNPAFAPEPSSIMLLSMSLMGLLFHRKKTSK